MTQQNRVRAAEAHRDSTQTNLGQNGSEHCAQE